MTILAGYWLIEDTIAKNLKGNILKENNYDDANFQKVNKFFKLFLTLVLKIKSTRIIVTYHINQ